MADHFDVVVVGAGPAGLAAAHAAASHGARVALLDALARAGGQVWRHDVHARTARAARTAMRRVQAQAQISWMAQATVVAAEADQLLVEQAGRARSVRYAQLVLATGARELLLPFPGWTLPGVLGAGGAQALTKQGWPIAGQRVVVAGTGPLLLAAAATLRAHGADVLGVYEQTPAHRLAAFAAHLWRWPAKAAQALAMRTTLRHVPYHSDAFVRAAHGDTALRSLDVHIAGVTQRIDCDIAAIGYGLVPNVELAQLLGCALAASGRQPCVTVDDAQRSSITNVFAAGEVCGIGGRDTARIEGAIAGHMAAGATRSAQALHSARRHARRFSALLMRHFALDARIAELADDDTVICRCEAVRFGAVRRFDSAREAKLQTRCGMGACQGRVCGTALAELGVFSPGGLRPPLFPVSMATLADAEFAAPPA